MLRAIQFVLVAVALFGMSAVAQAETIMTYNPGLGTLPTSQDWTLGNTSGGAGEIYNGASPTELHIGQAFDGSQTLPAGATTTAGYLYWTRADVPFDFLGTGYSIQLTARILSSSQASAQGIYRAGFGLNSIDANDRVFNVWIGDSEIYIENYDNTRVAAISYTPGDGYNTFLLSVDPVTSLATLSMNWAVLATVSVGGMNSGYPSNRVLFGDASDAQCEVLIRDITCTNAPTVIPEPGTLALLATGLLGLLCYAWRKQK